LAVDVSLGRANVAVRATLDKLDRDLDDARGKVKGVLGKVARGVGKNFLNIGKLAAGGLAAATGAAVGLGAALAKLAIDAAPVEGLSQAFYGLAESAGYGADEMLDALKRGSAGMVSQRDLMLSFNKAAQLVSTDFAVQLPDAMQYLSKVSAATGQNMNYLIDSLAVGVGRISPMILDNLGIQVSLADATGRAAEMFGMEADALDKAQVQAGMMNVVLEKLAANTAAMPDATETAAAGLARFSANMQDLRDTAGLLFGPVLKGGINVLSDLASSLLSAIEEGGALRPVLIDIVAIISSLIDVAGQLGPRFEEAFGVIGHGWTILKDLAFRALEWGGVIIVYLAIGMVRAAETVLVPALQSISKILAFWMAPGSSPRFLPDIDKWGTAAFSEYLQGFGAAEFDILEGLQGPLRSALSALVDAGALGEAAALPVFRRISAELTIALDQFRETGEVGSDIFEKLRTAGGEFGDDLAELARRQFALAAATRDVQLAEERLTAGRAEQEAAQDDLNSMMDEYNALLASGADPGVIAAKRAEFEAAKKRLAMAEDEIGEAEKQKVAAEERLEPLREQVQLQERLLRQLTQLSEGSKQTTVDAVSAINAIGDAAGGVAQVVEDAAAAAAGIGADIGAGIGAEIEATKLDFKARFDEIFGSIQTAWDTHGAPAMTNIETAWGGLQSSFEEFREWFEGEGFAGAMEQVMTRTFELGRKSAVKMAAEGLLPLAREADALLKSLGVEDGLAGAVYDLDDAIADIVETSMTSWLILADKLLKSMGVEDGLIGVVNDLDGAIADITAASMTTWLTLLDKLLKKLGVEEGLASILTIIEALISGDFTTAWKTLRTDILEPIKKSFDAIVLAAGNLLTEIGNLIDLLPKLDLPNLNPFKPGSPTPFELGLRGISEAMRELSGVEMPRLSDGLGAISVSAVPGGSLADPGAGVSPGQTNNLTMNVYTGAPVSTVIQDFEVMRALVG
jgi:hypothetical protein